jgi:hypothetical protein
MKSISKVIVGAAVAAACGYVSAATIAPKTVDNLSLESIQAQPAANVVNFGSTVLTLGQAYVQNDSVELSITGGAFATASATPTISCSNGAANTLTFSLVSASSSSSLLTYAVQTAGGVTAGQTCTIPSIAVTASSITGAGNVTLSSTSKKAATFNSFDSADSVTIGSVGSNYTIAIATVFDGVIDVTNQRLTFASGVGPDDLLTGATGFTGTNGDEDSFRFSVNVGARTNANGIAPTGTMVLTLTGSSGFGFLVDPTTDTAGTLSVGGIGAAAATAVLTGGASAGPTSVSAVNSTTLRVTVPTVAGALYTVALGRAATEYTAVTASQFSDQTFSAAVSLAMGTGTTRTASVGSTQAAGAWTLNGTTVNIPYLPINPNIDLVVNISNRSSQTGPVTFTAWNANGTSCTGNLGTVGANENMSVGSALKNALLGCTGTGWTGATRATVQLVMPTPRSTTAVNSSFSASDGKSRSIVVNDTNGYRN